MDLKHPGAFTDPLQMSATSSRAKTLHDSHQIWRNAEAGINGTDSGVVAPVVFGVSATPATAVSTGNTCHCCSPK